MPRTHQVPRGGAVSGGRGSVLRGWRDVVLSDQGNHDRLSPAELSAGLRSWPRGGSAFPAESQVGLTGQWATAPHLGSPGLAPVRSQTAQCTEEAQGLRGPPAC